MTLPRERAGACSGVSATLAALSLAHVGERITGAANAASGGHVRRARVPGRRLSHHHWRWTNECGQVKRPSAGRLGLVHVGQVLGLALLRRGADGKDDYLSVALVAELQAGLDLDDGDRAAWELDSLGGVAEEERRGAFEDDEQLLLNAVSYTHLRAHETRHDLVCR